MNEFTKILDDNEKVIWQGNPSFWPFTLGGSITVTVFGVFWVSFMACFGINSFQTEGAMKYILFATPHFWIGLILLFGPLIYSLLVYKHTHYAITDKRVIFQKGIIGRDFDMIDFDQITNVEVNVGIFDNLFGGNTGTINISSAGTFNMTKNGAVTAPYSFRNIENPYDVFKQVKKFLTMLRLIYNILIN